MASRSLFVLFILGTMLTAQDRISAIEFFGYGGLDVDAVRRTLSVHAGDTGIEQRKQQVREAVRRATGRDATDVTAVCCDEHGNSVLFVGLPGNSSRTFSHNAPAIGPDRLPPSFVALYNRMSRAEGAAIRRGGTAAQEQSSHGYRLLKDPNARYLELAVRRYAWRHEAELRRVLASSSNAEQRRMAADTLGYGKQTPAQIYSLVQACRDPDDGVRNNASRALGELATNPATAHQIPPEVFIDMIRSGVWTDRNKASFVLLQLTRPRDPALLKQLKEQALNALIEMAVWHDTGHAVPARILLARIAGLPEERMTELAFGDVQRILESVRRR